MERLVFYGKGGIGKSTLSSNVSVALAEQGRRVLHVGCDPKHDSTVSLMRGTMIRPVIRRQLGPVVSPAEIVVTAPSGVDCVEAGGPQPGVGCAGRGISLTIEIMERAALLSPERYDVVVFDLLGDVVCGGFAAPLRHRVGEKVIIVSSEEVMSLYAANNIARAVVHYASNGIVLAGAVLNVRDPDRYQAPAERLMSLLGTGVLGVIRHDPLVREAEYQRTTVMELAPSSELADRFRRLAEAIVRRVPGDCALPTPLTDEEFHTLSRSKFRAPPGFRREPTTATASETEGARSPEGGPSPDELARREYKRQLRSAIEAVQRGLVRPEEALDRLQRHFPELTRRLQLKDLA